MYEKYSRQALPERKYRELLGSAICVFNSNNAFVIENILKINHDDYNWYRLIELESGKILKTLKNVIDDNELISLFADIVNMRNRIIHSYQVTYNNCQILATKENDENDTQYSITEEYLIDFIKKNEKLCIMLYGLRSY